MESPRFFIALCADNVVCMDSKWPCEMYTKWEYNVGKDEVGATSGEAAEAVVPCTNGENF